MLGVIDLVEEVFAVATMAFSVAAVTPGLVVSGEAQADPVGLASSLATSEGAALMDPYAVTTPICAFGTHKRHRYRLAGVDCTSWVAWPYRSGYR